MQRYEIHYAQDGKLLGHVTALDASIAKAAFIATPQGFLGGMKPEMLTATTAPERS